MAEQIRNPVGELKPFLSMWVGTWPIFASRTSSVTTSRSWKGDRGLSRALSHRGKEYDFDFETSDTLVCTELVYRTFDGILKMREMELIMGKPRLPASAYVRMWAEGRSAETTQLELVRFFDFDESRGVAVEADAETLVETLERSRFIFVR